MILRNNKTFRELLRGIEGSFELSLFLCAYYFFFKAVNRFHTLPNYSTKGIYLLLFVYALLILALFALNKCFFFGRLKLSHIFISQTIDILIVDSITYFQLCLIANRLIIFLPVVFLILTDIVICFVCCYFFTSVYHKINMPRKMLMIYGNKRAITLKDKLNNQNYRHRVSSAIASDQGFGRIIEAITSYDAVVLNDVEAELRNDILKYCYENKTRTYVVPKVSDIIVRGADDITLFDTPLLLVKGTGIDIYQRIIKRIMDIVLCTAALIVFSPIMLIVAIAIKFDDHGPVFYTQERVTRDMKKFNIIKFRSMIVDAEKDGVSIPATDDDPRITKVGKVIRQFRIDELPQIFNIIKGEMSIVGPRPERTEHVEKYCKEIPEFIYRYKVKGGLTGYAQVYGKYNTTAYDKLRMDLIYIENYTLLLDIKLIIETVRILFSKDSTEGFINNNGFEEDDQ